MGKRKKSGLLLSLFLLVFTTPLFAQQQIKIGTDVPLQYALAYAYTPEKGLGGGVKIGLLAEPHNSIILALMEALGTKEYITAIVRESFKIGIVLDGNMAWNWSKNFAGLNVSYINLKAGQAPLNTIDENYGGIFNLIPSSLFSDETMAISLSSNLIQIGAHYGRRIPLDDKWELQFLLGVSKNMGSTNQFTSDFPYPQSLFNSIDEDLQENYKKYGIIPSIGIHLVYNL